jgi:hypothetical protein
LFKVGFSENSAIDPKEMAENSLKLNGQGVSYSVSNNRFYSGYYNSSKYIWPATYRRITDLSADQWESPPTCYDDMEYPDSGGEDYCDVYSNHYEYCLNPSYDTDNFTSSIACCVCGGGQFTPFDSNPPLQFSD